MSSARHFRSLCMRSLFFILRSLQLILTIVLIALTAHLITLYKTSPSSTSIDLTLLLFGSNTNHDIPKELIYSIFVASLITLYLLITYLIICFAHRGLFVCMMIADFLCMAGMIAMVVCLRSSGETAPGARICAIEKLSPENILEGYNAKRNVGWGMGSGVYLSSWKDCQVVKAGFAVSLVEAISFLFTMLSSYGLWRMHVQPEENIHSRRYSKESFRSSLESHPRRSVSEA